MSEIKINAEPETGRKHRNQQHYAAYGLGSLPST